MNGTTYRRRLGWTEGAPTIGGIAGGVAGRLKISAIRSWIMRCRLTDTGTELLATNDPSDKVHCRL
jgi:hypothetical protein